MTGAPGRRTTFTQPDFLEFRIVEPDSEPLRAPHAPM